MTNIIITFFILIAVIPLLCGILEDFKGKGVPEGVHRAMVRLALLVILLWMLNEIQREQPPYLTTKEISLEL